MTEPRTVPLTESQLFWLREVRNGTIRRQDLTGNERRVVASLIRLRLIGWEGGDESDHSVLPAGMEVLLQWEGMVERIGPNASLTMSISVRGAGALNLDGSRLNLDLHADWGRLAQLLPPGITRLSREVSNQLLRIKVRGSVGDVKFEQELVPLVVDPLKKVLTGLQ